LKTIYPNLTKELSLRGMTYRQLADEMGMSHLAMYRRLTGITRWSLCEAIRIRKFFNGMDIYYLFQEKEGR